MAVHMHIKILRLSLVLCQEKAQVKSELKFLKANRTILTMAFESLSSDKYHVILFIQVHVGTIITLCE